MANIWLQIAEASPKATQEFPFIAALILVAIIAVVGIGDMKAIEKNGSTSHKKMDEEKDYTQK